MLTLLLLVPVVGGCLAWLAACRSGQAARGVALAASLLALALSLALWSRWPAIGQPSLTAPLLEQQRPWIPALGISYHLLLDGLSLLLLNTTALLAVVAVLAAWREVSERPGAFFFLLLLLESSIFGVFLAVDLVLFYLFFELMLVPTFFLIRFWGYAGRAAAALKFFLYTFAGGLLMLASILGLHLARQGTGPGPASFDLAALAGTPLPPELGFLLMLGFFLGLAVKLPAVPLHGWLPDADTRAPLAATILAVAMLETGAYGLLRFAIPLYPEASAMLAPAAMALGVAGILYGGLLAFSQPNLRRVVAYGSIGHTGFVLLGIYAGTELALLGALVAMVAHMLTAGGLFFLAETVRRRCGTMELAELGGLWGPAPGLGGFTLFFGLALMGLPGLATFVGEILVLLGAFSVDPLLGGLAAAGSIVSVIYALRLVQAMVLGPDRRGGRIDDLGRVEAGLLGLLALGLLALGLHPGPVFQAARAPLAVVEQSLRASAGSGGGPQSDLHLPSHPELTGFPAHGPGRLPGGGTEKDMDMEGAAGPGFPLRAARGGSP